MEDAAAATRVQALARGVAVRAQIKAKKKREKQERNRRRVVMEMVSTEETYNASLQIMIEFILTPLKWNAENSPEPKPSALAREPTMALIALDEEPLTPGSSGSTAATHTSELGEAPRRKKARPLVAFVSVVKPRASRVFSRCGVSFAPATMQSIP